LYDIEENPTIKGVLYEGKKGTQERKPTSSEIYSEIENIRDLGLKQLSEAFTKTNKFNEKLGFNNIEITIYYQPKCILSIAYKVYNVNGKRVSYKIFDFDKSNSCRLFSIFENQELGEFTFAFWNGFLLSTDSKYNSKVIEGEDKQRIIQSTKLSLDSLMHRFPEFKYSLNWK